MSDSATDQTTTLPPVIVYADPPTESEPSASEVYAYTVGTLDVFMINGVGLD